MKGRGMRRAGVFDELMQGLRESLAHARGELTLRTTTLPMPPPAVSPARVAKIRHRLGMSQAVFAALLNVSKKTVQSWEQGTRVPRAGDLRLLQIAAEEPVRLEQLVAGTHRRQKRRPKAMRAA
jgi:putative transcriptional regulator